MKNQPKVICSVNSLIIFNGLCFFVVHFFLWFNCFFANAQDNIHVSDRQILGPCGDTLLLKGINYSPYNWGWSPNQLKFDEIAKTEANCVRIVWYKTGGAGSPASVYSNLSNLDSALSRCVKKGMIPIIELHDQTCQNSPSNLIALANWFSQTGVKLLIDKYKYSLILNLANEALHVNWTGNPSASRIIFQSTYNTIVQNLRSSGIEVPLMIDAPDCGTNLEALSIVGPGLLSNDPLHNLIFSAHAYWYSYAGNDSTQMAIHIGSALAANIAFVFGEVANLQDDVSLCQYALNFKPLLRICKNQKIGWLAWSWDNDVCAARQISSNGNFSSLTSYGQEMVFNSEFGLSSNPAIKSRFLRNGNCDITSNVRISHSTDLKIIPNPCHGSFSVLGLKDGETPVVFNLLGEHIKIENSGQNNQFHISGSAIPGVFWVQMGEHRQKFFVVSGIL